jgi:Tol biopolymer transport system component
MRAVLLELCVVAAFSGRFAAQQTAPSDQELRNPIVFVRSDSTETGEGGKIWIMEEDGSRARQLTFGNTYDEHPAVFSNRRHFLYSEFSRPPNPQNLRDAILVKLDMYTGRREVYAEVPGCALHHVTLSATDVLVYQHDCGTRLSQRVGWGSGSYELPILARNGVAAGEGSVIFMHEKNQVTPRQVALVRLDGHGAGATATFLTDDRHLHRRPAVSPDGAWTAWQTNAAGGRDEVFLARRDGSNVRNVTNNPALDGHPWFSRDGNWIVFESDRTGSQEIWRMNVASLKPEQLTFDRAHPSRTPRW